MRKTIRGALRGAALCAAMAAPGGVAAAPKVAVDIAPVHALVARVMAGVGSPDLILPPGASPHGHAMRPSEAAALDAAEVVFWVGPGLTPWFASAVETLGADARRVQLSNLAGLNLLAATDDGHDHGGAPAAGHDENDEHDKNHKDDHAKDHDDGHGPDDHHDDDHAAGSPDAETVETPFRADPHIWLEPVNAATMTLAIAVVLAEADPDNAETYVANARAGVQEIQQLVTEISDTLAPVRGTPYIVFHDAYRYFEQRFGIAPAGAITVSDAVEPGAARVAAIRATIAQRGARCIFTEPQFPPRLAQMLAEGTGARLAVLDPLGTSLAEPGPGLYPALLRGLAGSLRDCLSGNG